MCYFQVKTRPDRDSNSGHGRERAAFLASELSGLSHLKQKMVFKTTLLLFLFRNYEPCYQICKYACSPHQCPHSPNQSYQNRINPKIFRNASTYSSDYFFLFASIQSFNHFLFKMSLLGFEPRTPASLR